MSKEIELQKQIDALKIRAFDAQEIANSLDAQVKSLSGILQQACAATEFELPEDGGLNIESFIQHLTKLSDYSKVEVEAGGE